MMGMVNGTFIDYWGKKHKAGEVFDAAEETIKEVGNDEE